MKRFFVIFCTVLFAVSLTACKGNGNTNRPGTNGSDPKETKEDFGTISVENALALLTTVWDSYEEEEKFPAAGGDMSEAHMTMDAPGIFDPADADALDATLGFPKAFAEKIDDAASLVHMMNANTFTCGAFHVKNAADSADISAAIKENIMQRQWMCGFPDKLVIVKAGDYVIAFFGSNEIVDTFQAKLTAAYASAEALCDEPID